MRSSLLRSEGDHLVWPILLLLLTVLVPSVGVVWMMREAVQNERLATNQRLTEAYQAQLKTASQTLQDRWESILQQAVKRTSNLPPPKAFAALVKEGFVDSAIIRNKALEILYPVPSKPLVDMTIVLHPDWKRGETLEFNQQDFKAADVIYRKIAEETGDLKEQAQANQARVRCLLEIGDKDQAIAILRSLQRKTNLTDERGRSYAIAAKLRLLQILGPNTSEGREVATNLTDSVNSYDEPMSSAQRRYVMTELQRVTPSTVCPTQQAESLAVNYLMNTSKLPTDQMGLLPTAAVNQFYQLIDNGKIIALYKTDTLLKRFNEILETISCPSGVAYIIYPTEYPKDNLFKLSLSKSLQGWEIGLAVVGEDLFAVSSQQRKAVHLWITLLIVGVTFVLAWLLAKTLHQRLKLAQLKNDLVATVSHELKTPLTSVRLLVDTLLETTKNQSLISQQSEKSPIHLREYLHLISQENARLTRLIEKFLTFSSIEKGKHRLSFKPLAVSDLMTASANLFVEHVPAVQGVIDRECLEVQSISEAWIEGDHDALVMAIVNLLENAWKYGGDDKRIILSSATVGDLVTISVSDNGRGLGNQDKKRIFDKFYQVDQRVARSEEGCGLGLSIVSSIIKEHRGDIKVQSKLNVGSTFTLEFAKIDEKMFSSERKR